MHTHTHTDARTYTHIHTHIHTYIHTHAHTHTHTLQGCKTPPYSAQRSRRLLRHRLYLSLVPPPCLFLFRPSLFRTYCLSTHVGTLNNQTELNFFGNMKTCLAKFNGSLLEAIQIGAQHRYSFIPSSLFPFRGLPAFNSTINLLLASSLKIS